MIPWMLLMCLQAAEPETARAAAPAEMRAMWTTQPVKIDGRCDDAVWREAPTYPLQLSLDRTEHGERVHESGSVQLAYDDQYLYAAFRFTDSDVVQESDEDQQHFYRTGDVAELFLKPEGATWYWELYVTPNGRRTAFFFPGRGRLGLPSCFEYVSSLRVAGESQGSLNDWHDRDEGWTAELAMPLRELASQGIPLTPGQPWRILVGRYNYSRYLHAAELSMHPALPVTDFHRIDDYGILILEPAQATTQTPATPAAEEMEK